MSTSYIYSHEWYDEDCCDDQDCKEMSQWSEDYSVSLDPTGNYYRVIIPEENIDKKIYIDNSKYPYMQNRVRPSRDSDYHACIIKSPMAKPLLRCIYIPLNG